MLRLQLPRTPYGLFVYDFLYIFSGIVGSCGLRPMCLHSNGHHVISLTDFYNGPVYLAVERPCGQRLCGHHAVSTAMHRNRTDIARHPCCFLTEAAQRSYSGCMIVVYFWAYVYQMCTTTLFFIKMTLQTCKTKYSMRQRHQLTQTMAHRKAAACSWCGQHEIAAQ